MFKIEIDLDLEDFEGIDFKNDTDKNYILENYKDIIQGEVESLYDLISNSNDSIAMINTINDNQGELLIQNENGDNEYTLGFYTTITI